MSKRASNQYWRKAPAVKGESENENEGSIRLCMGCTPRSTAHTLDESEQCCSTCTVCLPAEPYRYLIDEVFDAVESCVSHSSLKIEKDHASKRYRENHSVKL
jgi:hypothetical protein